MGRIDSAGQLKSSADQIWPAGRQLKITAVNNKFGCLLLTDTIVVVQWNLHIATLVGM